MSVYINQHYNKVNKQCNVMFVLLLVSIDLSEQLHIVGWSGGYAVTWDGITADHCQPVPIIV